MKNPLTKDTIQFSRKPFRSIIENQFGKSLEKENKI
jgi:hypothetical protein